MLENKLYAPYFISKQTILQYQDYDPSVRLSIMDIIEQLHYQKKINSKLYFKVDLNEKIQTKDDISEPDVILEE